MTTYRKFIIIVLVCIALMVLVKIAGGENAAMARHFLRNLVHYLF